MEYIIVLISLICLGSFLIFFKVTTMLKIEIDGIYKLLNQVSHIIKSQQEQINNQLIVINNLQNAIIIDDKLVKSDVDYFNLDIILEKISKTGIDSLSDEELDFLNKSSKK